MRRYLALYFNAEIRMVLGMKTTLDINDELLHRARVISARERKSLTAFVEEGLRLRLHGRHSRQARRSHLLPVYLGKSGLARGVDPTTSR
jgi:hypothetical protein